MRARELPIVAVLVAGVVVRTAPCAEESVPALAGGAKLRILVDKVMQPEEGWTTREWMVREAKEAGFNVFSPRRGHDRLDEVRQVTEWCRAHGMLHLPWMRGTLGAPPGEEARGQRVLWANGSEQPLWSACSDAFWDWTTRYIVAYAKLSAENGSLIGVFLDYENYWPGGGGNLYDITYEDAVLVPFAKEKGLELPALKPDARRAWLEGAGLLADFVEFQLARWRARCRALRSEVDRYNPRFRFCVYPAPGTRFIVEAAYPELSTERAPILLADASVYGRPSRFQPQDRALEANRQKLLERMAVPRAAGVRFVYLGGIDPAVRGADPEFSGKNAVLVSSVADGYWVFYEGVQYRDEHPAYFRWFRWANRHIEEGTLDAWRAPRETAERWALDVFETLDEGRRLVPPEPLRPAGELPDVRLRGENLIVLAVRTGETVRVGLRNVPVGRYESILVWEVRKVDGTRVAAGTVPHEEEGSVHFTPEDDGIYVLGASSGSCAWRVVRANVPLGLYAGGELHLIRAAERLVFHVPGGLRRFEVAARGNGSETVRVDVLGPDGKLAAFGETSPIRESVKIAVPVDGRGAGTWSLRTSKAQEGVLEDYTLRLDRRLPPVLGLRPGDVFEMEETE